MHASVFAKKLKAVNGSPITQKTVSVWPHLTVYKLTQQAAPQVDKTNVLVLKKDVKLKDFVKED